MKRTEALYLHTQKWYYVIFALFFTFTSPRIFIDEKHSATNMTVKLFQFHASRLRIDNFLRNGRHRDHGIVRKMRLSLYERSREKS